LVKLFEDVTGWKPRMWGPTIIGFGAYHYTYESGHSGSICAVGNQLGKHKGGIKQCLYINKLSDVPLVSLKTIVRKSLVELRKMWPVTAS
jgi:hypothetical protein